MDECPSTFDTDTGLNYGQIFFMLLGLLPFMICLPPLIVAKLVWEPMEKERQISLKLFKEARKEWKKANQAYERKYPLAPVATNNDTKLNNIIVENTPDGYVAMRYNDEEKGFEYWSNKTIAYKYLETVARKYANTFHCTNIYIDRGKHLKEKIERLTKEIKENIEAKKKLEQDKKDVGTDETTTESKKQNVFVNLKTYNTNIKMKTAEKEKLTRDDYVCDVANKYIKKGKFTDSKHWMTANKMGLPQKSTTSWLSWKLSNNDV